MPMTVNGIGTMYYGKRNLDQRKDICGQCGNEAVLSTYDTTLYVTFLFIPLIPLGKKHIIDDCSSCRKHFKVNYSKWQKGLEDSLAEAQSKYKQNPHDAEAAKGLITAFSVNRDEGAFFEIAGEILQNHRTNHEILCLAASVCEGFDRHQEAEKLLHAAMEIKDDTDTREMLAEVLFSQLKADEAAGLLQHIFDEQMEDKILYPLLLAQCYQAKGEHQKALEVLGKTESLNPKKSQFKALYKKLCKLSQKKEFSNDAVTNQFSEPLALKGGSELNAGGRIAKVAGPIVIIFLVSLYVVSAFMKGRSRNVYLVNGLDREYTVTVNGKSYPVGANGRTVITVAEGKLDLSVIDEILKIADHSCTIKTSFASRPFKKYAFIINPDRTAVVRWEKIYYAERPEDAPQGQEKLHVGQVLYDFEGIDYVFEEFPMEIEISSGSSAPRTRVSLLSDEGIVSGQVPWILAELQGQDVAVDYLIRRIGYEPENEMNLYMLAGMTRPEQFTEIIKPGLAARPVRVEWHRFYQTIMESTRASHDLEAEYRKLLEGEPDNKSLQYLLARILTDSEESELYLTKSTSGDNPSAYGFNAIAYSELSMGRFDDAMDNARKAIEMAPDNASFTDQYHLVLLARGDLAELIDHYRKAQEKDPQVFSWMKEEAILLCSSGRHQEAEARLDAWISKNKDHYTAEELAAVRKTMDIEFAYLSGDLDEYSRLAKDSSDATDRFQYCVTYGEPAEPNCIDQIKNESPYAFLLLYMSQYLAGNEEAAEKYLLDAVERVGNESREGKVIADALCGPEEPDADVICELAMVPRTKSIALTALGLRYPNQKERYFELARKLNFEKTFPHLFLKAIHEKPLTKTMP